MDERLEIWRLAGRRATRREEAALSVMVAAISGVPVTIVAATEEDAQAVYDRARELVERLDRRG